MIVRARFTLFDGIELAGFVYLSTITLSNNSPIAEFDGLPASVSRVP